MRTVLVSNRSVYHKYAEIEVKVPDDIPSNRINEWLANNENEYDGRMDSAIDASHYHFGIGLGNGMEEAHSDSEWRYDILEDGEHKSGGHL
jgi:hypothetical protein